MTENAGYFAPLREERHMSLVTFRSSGAPVPTPIWFAEVRGRLYVRTASHFKKLERIAADPRVTVAPCTQAGDLLGEPIPAEARILSPEDSRVQEAEAALESRYPEERPAMTRLMTENGWEGVYVEIRSPLPGGLVRADR